MKKNSRSKLESKRQGKEAPEAVPAGKREGRFRTAVKQAAFTLIIFVVFFGGLELILALAGVKPILLTEDPMVGFSSNVPLFVEQRQADGAAVMRTASNKLSKFNDQSFAKTKGENTYRIFTLGGSTTVGRPFDHKVSFGGWLQAFLDEAEPGTDWEVINAGGSSYASYRVAKLMQELVQYEPDLFIVYSGHNEFLEERSYSGVTELPSWVIELDSMLSGTRTYSGMKRLYDSWQPDSMREAQKRYELSGEVDTILEYTFGPTSYHRDDELSSQVVGHYRLNLERMALMARDAGAGIIFVTPANNLKDFSPFKSEHREGLSGDALNRFNQAYEAGYRLFAAGKPREALALYREALGVDDRFADLYFQMGQAHFVLGDYAEAERLFWRAVDEDVAPLRMISSLQDSLVEVARDRAVPVVDFQQILRRAYLQEFGYPVPGNEYFLDHVHTSIDGYRILGLGLFDKLRDLGIVPPGAALSAEQVAAVKQQVESVLDMEDHYLSLFQLAKVLDWAGKFDEAKHLFLKHMELYGPKGDVYAQLGMVAAKRGNNAEAIDFFQKAIDAGYETPDVYIWMANTYRNQGQNDLAMQAYRDKLRLDGNRIEAHTFFGIQYVMQGDNASALGEFRSALELAPGFLPARRNLVVTLFALGQYDEALPAGQALLREHPEEFRIHYVVGSMLLQRGDRNAAITHFSAAVRLAPDFKPAQDALDAAQGMRSG